MSITSANAIYTLTIPLIFPQGQQIQNFSTDEEFDTDALDAAEAMMGVDGILTAGFINVPVPQTITLMADSVSGFVFDQWFAYEKQNQTKAPAIGSIVLPDLNMQYTMPKGFLKTYPPIPSAGKTLKPRKFGIVWESIQVTPTA